MLSTVVAIIKQDTRAVTRCLYPVYRRAICASLHLSRPLVPRALGSVPTRHFQKCAPISSYTSLTRAIGTSTFEPSHLRSWNRLSPPPAPQSLFRRQLFGKKSDGASQGQNVPFRLSVLISSIGAGSAFENLAMRILQLEHNDRPWFRKGTLFTL